LEKESRRSIYIETIREDSIVFWETYSRFERDFSPFSKEICEDSKKLELSDNYFLRNTPPAENFPSTGYILTIETNDTDFSNVKRIITEYFSPLHECIQFNDNNPKFEIIFPTYETVKSYLNPLYLLMSKSFPAFRDELN
jgi:hypothetical protein